MGTLGWALLYVVGVALGCWIEWAIIRSAVGRGIEDAAERRRARRRSQPWTPQAPATAPDEGEARAAGWLALVVFLLIAGVVAFVVFGSR